MRITALILLSAAVVLGQDDQGPGRGVARISVLNGEVSVRRGDSGDLVAAAINAPLVVQDRVLTGPASRAEVQFDYANMIRLGSSTEVRLSELEYGRYQVQVAIGITTFRVLRDSDAAIEIATPSVSVRPLKKGIYRVSVREDGSCEITVRSGEAEIYTPKGTERLRSGSTMIARGTVSDPEFQIVGSIPPDDWDRWNESRDRDLERSSVYRYVSPDVYGAEDLDSYGRWVDVAPYGYVWSPAVAAGWAPYRYGRWTWIDWYGWSWVSYDPWGWAPYHYGRWFNSGPYGWCWYPGPIHNHHYWSPALVSFFGWGGTGFGVGVGFGFGWGNIGWVPLAPHEPFHRWWGPGYYGHGGYNNVTIVNNTNITNVYRNARVTNAITAVEANNFGRARITNSNMIRLGAGDLSRVNLVRGQLPIAPGRESLAMSDRTVRTADVPRVADNRHFFSRQQPTAVARIPFEQQRQQMQAFTRRTYSDTPGRSLVAQPGREVAPAGGGSPGTPSRAADGWRRFGNASGGASEAPNANSGRTADNTESAWRRVGDSPSRGSAAPAVRQTLPVERSTPATSGSGNWRRFGEPTRGINSYERPAGRSEQVAPRSEVPNRGTRMIETPSRSEANNWQRFQGGSAPGAGRQNFGSEQVRINPPIVRERVAPMAAPRMESPRTDFGGGRGSFGGGGAPRMSAPPSGGGHVAAPAATHGGGGGGRSGGGGGRASGGGRSR